MVYTGTPSVVQINGPALRVIRERSGVSCSALARAVGVDVSFLARIERGEKRGLRREAWERISFELEIDGRAVLVNPYGESVTGATPPLRGHSGPTVIPCGGKASSTRVA